MVRAPIGPGHPHRIHGGQRQRTGGCRWALRRLIELFNAGTQAVDLAGWALTDRAGDLNQWLFPATNLQAGAYLVVFASNKDRRIPGQELHTNFKLSADAEYLALVKPDGVTIATEFIPQFPPQFSNVSFGFGSDQHRVGLVSTNAPLRGLGADPWQRRIDVDGNQFQRFGLDPRHQRGRV